MLDGQVARYVFFQICKQVKKLHDIGIAHRDLKPENMFFTDDKMGGVKLIDLGSSEDVNQPEIRDRYFDPKSTRNHHKYFVGTSQYMAPECIHNKPTGLYSDIWSLGCILF